VLLAGFLTVACSESNPTAALLEETPAVLGDPVAGMVAFRGECAPCHATGDGLDLAFFDFQDTTIVRRAVAHVDTATALDIVAHVQALSVRPVDRTGRIFQPGDRILSDDVTFAIDLFGSDTWPASLTTRELLGIDPLDVSAAVALPLWSVEEGNTDWMPDAPLPDYILDARESLPRALVAGYRAAPTESNLILATNVLRAATVQREDPRSPCFTNEPERANYQQCFEIQRWISTFTAQHMLRFGTSTSIHPTLHDVWWDVGMTVRRALVQADLELENARHNWAAWMYLGWIFEPSRHASTYTAQGLTNLGLNRHATFVALRSQVARPEASFATYADLTTTARHAPPHWLATALSFGYRHVVERLARGDVPREMDREEARRRIERSYVIAARRTDDPAVRVHLLGEATTVLEAFDSATGGAP
jgi:hypothetical protein